MHFMVPLSFNESTKDLSFLSRSSKVYCKKLEKKDVISIIPNSYEVTIETLGVTQSFRGKLYLFTKVNEK